MKAVQDGATRYITIRRIYRDYIQPRALNEVSVYFNLKEALFLLAMMYVKPRAIGQ